MNIFNLIWRQNCSDWISQFKEVNKSKIFISQHRIMPSTYASIYKWKTNEFQKILDSENDCQFIEHQLRLFAAKKKTHEHWRWEDEEIWLNAEIELQFLLVTSDYHWATATWQSQEHNIYIPLPDRCFMTFVWTWGFPTLPTLVWCMPGCIESASKW